MHSRQPAHHPNLRLHHYLRHHFSICLYKLRFGSNTTENLNKSGCYIKFSEKMWIIPILLNPSCPFSPNTVWSNDMSRKCEMHILNFFHLSMNLRIYCKFDLNHPVAYFPFRNLYTFCMHRLTRKQPIKRLVLGDVISRSFLPERSLIFCYISHDWKEDKFLYTMIYRLKIICFDHHGYTGIYDKMHGLTREVDNSTFLCQSSGPCRWFPAV